MHKKSDTILPLHRLAEPFPPLPDDELDLLAKDIAANGLREPITARQGQVLDGRNRQAAFELAASLHGMSG